MTQISLRKNLFKKIRMKKFLKFSDSEFRLQLSFRHFKRILEEIEVTNKVIGEYERAVWEFLIFLELTDISITEAMEIDLELFKEILIKRGHDNRSAKTKITRIRAYLYIYEKMNSQASMQGDLSMKEIIKEVKQLYIN